MPFLSRLSCFFICLKFLLNFYLPSLSSLSFPSKPLTHLLPHASLYITLLPDPLIFPSVLISDLTELSFLRGKHLVSTTYGSLDTDCLEKEAELPINLYLTQFLVFTGMKVYGDAFMFKKMPN